ncbi:MAG: DUF459 domain-containing protein [Solirubrobacterales bacterium]|nr:DUF459 domain-containing protein [Solirubrobacterales bacterium]
MTDDSLMDRFDANARRFQARDALIAVFVAVFVLVLFQGRSLKGTGEKLGPGPQRDVVLAISRPAGWLAAQLPLQSAAAKVTSGLSPDQALDDSAGFDAGSGGATVSSPQVPVVTPDAFTPESLGAQPAAKKPLETVLVTGDSLSTPLDQELGRTLAGSAQVIRDPHLGTGISKTELVDWGKLSATQTAKHHPDAVVVFIGANEGFEMKDPAGHEQACCGARWAAIYANRARRMIDTYRQGGRAHVYWVTVMTPRDADHARISNVVNAAIAVAAQPWPGQVSVVDTVPIFTPGGRYRDSMPVAGRSTLVRESDGIHLNLAGAQLLARTLLERLRRDFDS